MYNYVCTCVFSVFVFFNPSKKIRIESLDALFILHNRNIFIGNKSQVGALESILLGGTKLILGLETLKGYIELS